MTVLKTFLTPASTLFLAILCFAGSAVASEASQAAPGSAAEPSAAEEKQGSAEPAPAPEIRRVITGRVMDDTGNGVAGARVWLRSAARNRHVAETETDATGRFDLDSLEAGRVVLRVKHPDFAPYRHGWILEPAMVLDPLTHEPETLSITLVEGAEIRGRLLGLESEENSPVFLFAARNNEAPIGGDWIEGDRYRFRHVPVGRWQIVAKKGQGAQLAKAHVEVSSQVQVVEQDLDFRQGVSFSGRVRHEQGLGQPAVILLSQESGSLSHSIRVDEQGYFRASGLPKGLYHVDVVVGREVDIRTLLVGLRSDRKMDIDIAPAVLVGKVQGRKDASVQISIQRVEPVGHYPIFEAEKNGSFERELPPGRYRILFFQEGSRIEERVVELSPGRMAKGLEVELQPVEPWELRLELPSGLEEPNAVLFLESEGGEMLWHGSYYDLGDEALRIPVRPHGEDWRLLIYAEGTAAEAISARDLREELTTVRLDPSAVIWLQTPWEVLPTMEQYLREFKLRVLTDDGRIYRQPPPQDGFPMLMDEWDFFPYRRAFALTYLSEGDWILELTSPEGDTLSIPVTTKGRVTEIVRDFP